MMWVGNSKSLVNGSEVDSAGFTLLGNLEGGGGELKVVC